MELTHAGAVTYRRSQGALEYLVVSSSNGSAWVLPKGHIEAGEQPAATALRELVEEAGVDGKIVEPLGLRRFQKHGETVVVRYYLVEASAVGIGTEQRTVQWHAKEAAVHLLSFPDAQDALCEGASKLEAKESR